MKSKIASKDILEIAEEIALEELAPRSVMAPPTDLLRIWTGRILLDIPLLGD